MRHFIFPWDRFLAILFVSAFLHLHAGDLPRAKPEEVGLSSQRLAMITEVLKADVASAITGLGLRVMAFLFAP